MACLPELVSIISRVSIMIIVQREVTALMMAVRQGYPACVSILAASGANVNKTVCVAIILENVACTGMACHDMA